MPPAPATAAKFASTGCSFFLLWLRFGPLAPAPASALMPGGMGMGMGMAPPPPPPPPPYEAREEEATEAPLPREEAAEAPVRDLGGLCGVVWWM